jgi:hypothetical protein
MQHNHRGLPTRRYQVWTALHNFDCRATDGTNRATTSFTLVGHSAGFTLSVPQLASSSHAH